MNQIDGNKMYFLAIIVAAMGLFEAGVFDSSTQFIDWTAAREYFLGGAFLAALRSAMKKQEAKPEPKQEKQQA